MRGKRFSAIPHTALRHHLSGVTCLSPRGEHLRGDSGVLYYGWDVEVGVAGEPVVTVTNRNDLKNSVVAYVGVESEGCKVYLDRIPLGRHTRGKKASLPRKAQRLGQYLMECQTWVGPKVRTLKMLSVPRAEEVLDRAADLRLLPRIRGALVWKHLRTGFTRWDMLLAFARVSEIGPEFNRPYKIYRFCGMLLEGVR